MSTVRSSGSTVASVCPRSRSDRVRRGSLHGRGRHRRHHHQPPQAKNAVNAAVASQVAEALDDLDARKDLSVGIITGAGGTFCAGMDLKAFMKGEVPTIEGRGFGGFAE